MSVFRILDLDSAGKVTAATGEDGVRPPPEGVLRWIDLGAQNDDSLELIRKRFDFHPLAIEDCAHFDQRPKLEDYGGYLFLVILGFTCPSRRAAHLVLHELHAFLSERYLVTVHRDELPALEEIWKRASADATLFRRGVDFVYYAITDRVADAHFPLLDHFSDELEELEDHVLLHPKRRDLTRVFELKRGLVHLRKVLAPQRDMLAVLARRDDPRVSERTSVYFRDVYDHLARLTESIEAHRDLLGNVLDAYLTAASNRTNEVMKYLTLLSAVFLPLAFVVGFFGQNFDNFPGMRDWVHSDALMYAMIVICLATPAAMLAWFRKKGWF